ncbi:hypothetical protein [Bradyrhizobium sp. 170]|jgi:hypothetical protein|uniref:hypothetical protein n=1 Tax=Bradyrhizobium sp. 170 TaxID=2782641 RepID=UPI001FFE4E11|nr:hypothetical protein [Bradyrhizobium sp. 170]UPK06268.1 hypothetical protein IVB05_12400 [Bradyrhizobium sp. 170]
MLRRRFKQTSSLKERLAERANEIRAQAEALPPGSIEREQLELQARQADTVRHINEWLMSPGLQPPK